MPSPISSPNGAVTLDQLLSALRNGLNPVETGQLVHDTFLSGYTLQALSKELAVTSGTLHHYRSLVIDLAPELRPLVVKHPKHERHYQSGKLVFKVARCLADVKGWPRQVELAQPFLTRQMSSVNVEPFIAYARKHPEMKVPELMSTFTARHTEVPKPPPELPKAAPKPVLVDSAEVTRDLLRLAGQVEMLGLSKLPEIELLPLRSAYRLLTSRGMWLAQKEDER